VIISHRERRVDLHTRLDSGQWLATAFTSDDASMNLPVVGGDVKIADIYGNVTLDAAGSRG